jgi:hypothetical protein
MAVLTAAQWVVWGIAAFFAAGNWRTYFRGGGTFGGTIGTTLAQSIMVLWTLFRPTMNKFHLLWLVPLSYPFGMVLETPFMLGRLPKSFPIYATVGVFIAILYFLTP